MNELSSRHEKVKKWADMIAPDRDDWIKKNEYYYEEDIRYMKFLVPEGLKILDIGCGTGELLAELKPSKGVGVDLSSEMLEKAKDKYPDMEFIEGNIEDEKFVKKLEGPFDVIIILDTLGYFDDCQKTLESLHCLCDANTRIITAYHSYLWKPVFAVASLFGQRMPDPLFELNWLEIDEISNLFNLADFEIVKKEWKQLLPKEAFGFGPFINKYVATLPFIRKLCVRHYVVARSMKKAGLKKPSVSIVIPCRNEKGNIEEAIKRTPKFCDDMEIIYIEGHSSDGTWEEVQRVKKEYADMDIKAMQQPGRGKGDAVFTAFEKARGDILMILDADLTMPPEELPKFYEAIRKGKGEFINGSRLVYVMEDEAMRFLNYWANRTFALIFSYLLNQRFTDTLCGTKVLTKKAYDELDRNRSYFGDFDPFGDFDLIFGASKLNLKVTEIPIRYASRKYGTTQISRFSHGWLLLKMVLFAYKRLKAF